MGYFFVKTLVTALIVAGVSELSRRYSLIAAALVSLPLTSILAFIWIYNDTKDSEKIIELSYSIFWLVLPSLSFFILLPLFLKEGMKFFPALALSSVLMAGLYGIFMYAKSKF